MVGGPDDRAHVEGSRPDFPATITDEGATIVAGKYHKLLDAEASEGWSYVLGMVAVWLLPHVMLLLGMAVIRAFRSFRRASRGGRRLGFS